ncbi:hypothetical protein NXS19_009128 [Fusarium pseudograminearum]|nr:hypothetical protein NXS19_009128 [Fusarium pseudograminearum]
MSSSRSVCLVAKTPKSVKYFTTRGLSVMTYDLLDSSHLATMLTINHSEHILFGCLPKPRQTLTNKGHLGTTLNEQSVVA